MAIKITNPAVPNALGGDYSKIGNYVSDDMWFPFHVPSDVATAFPPGAPILMKFGAANEEQVVMSKELIRPGDTKPVTRYFTADFPCNFSGNVILGDEVMWDVDNDVLSLAADVTNGFVVGLASYAYSSGPAVLEQPTVDGNDRVICATSTSTKVRVISLPGKAVTIKGTVTIY